MNPVDRFERRLYVYHLYHGICQGCGEPLAFDEMELAHCICDSKWAKKKYGKHVVNSIHNLRPTHRGACNDKVLISFNPGKCAEIVAAVEAGG
jgi:hypothetical protein